jgi:aminoglycoside phosphotransferase (APT) family kinase protein
VTALGPGFDDGALHRWLAEHVEEVAVPAPGRAELRHEVISGGASNLTIGVQIGDADLVVRRPPVGQFLPTANDVAREYRYLGALRDTPVPVPRVYAFCDDADVIGAPFYVMERLHGVVPHDAGPVADLSAEEGRRLSERFVDVLRSIHEVDIDAVGLGDAAKRSGYLERQVRRWTDQWHRAKEADSPAIDELAVRLAATLPASPPTTVVHGDYRLGNVMLDAADRTQVIGVFDWEMATLGDPLADVGYTLLYWGTTDRPPVHPSQVIADRPGFLSAAGVAERYGVELGVLDFYVVLAAFKLAIIGEGNRARARQVGAPVLGTAATAGPSLAEWALERSRSLA